MRVLDFYGNCMQKTMVGDVFYSTAKKAENKLCGTMLIEVVSACVHRMFDDTC